MQGKVKKWGNWNGALTGMSLVKACIAVPVSSLLISSEFWNYFLLLKGRWRS